MKMETLLAGLQNPQPEIRLNVVRVLGMVDEVRALPALATAYKTETHPDTREAIAWAGKRLQAAKEAGHSTINEIFRYFGVDREIENMEGLAEAELMQKMQDNFDAEMIEKRSKGGAKRAGYAMLASALGGVQMGMAYALQSGAKASSGLEKRPELGRQRVAAKIPSNANIDVWVRRLRDDVDPGTRESAALELRQLNNPAALPYLATAFISDPVPSVREAAQRHGKIIYWNAVYWQMERDGSFQEEMDLRIEAAGKGAAPQSDSGQAPGVPTNQQVPPAGQTSPAQDEDVGAILRRAEAARKRRNLRSKKD